MRQKHNGSLLCSAHTIRAETNLPDLLEALQHLAGSRDIHRGVVRLNKSLCNFAVFNQNGIPARSQTTKHLGRIEENVPVSGEFASGVGQKPHLVASRGVGDGLTPGLGDKWIVDGDNVEMGNALIIEVSEQLVVSRHMRSRASRRESTWNANDQGFRFTDLLSQIDLIAGRTFVQGSTGDGVTDLDCPDGSGMERSCGKWRATWQLSPDNGPQHEEKR